MDRHEEQADSMNRDEDSEIVRRQIDPDPDTAEFDFLEVVAALEDSEINELPSLYEQLSHFIEQLFENPPSSEAQMQLEFTYGGYRITLDQHGHLTLVSMQHSVDEF